MMLPNPSHSVDQKVGTKWGQAPPKIRDWGLALRDPGPDHKILTDQPHARSTREVRKMTATKWHKTEIRISYNVKKYSSYYREKLASITFPGCTFNKIQ